MRPFSSRVAALYLEPPQAAGFLFVEPVGKRVFLLLRSPEMGSAPETWGMPGGRLRPGERPYSAAVRECREEVGRVPEHEVLEAVLNDGYVSYLATVKREEPGLPTTINEEHTDFVWADSDWLRQHWTALHPGVPPLLEALAGYFG